MQDYRAPLEPENFYHLYNHSNGNDVIFKTHENYMFFMRQYTQRVVPVCDTFAYCLMPNHFHFLIRVLPENKLEKYFQQKYERRYKKAFLNFQTFGKLVSKEFSNLFSSYTQAFNTQKGRIGSLFNPNFKQKKIDSEKYLIKTVHYIHNNPIHHGFVGKIEDWKYSSYLALITTKPTLLKRNEVIEWFDDLQNFKFFHKQNIDV